MGAGRKDAQAEGYNDAFDNKATGTLPVVKLQAGVQPQPAPQQLSFRTPWSETIGGSEPGIRRLRMHWLVAVSTLAGAASATMPTAE